MLLHEKNLRKAFLAFKQYLLNHQAELGNERYFHNKNLYTEKVKKTKKFNDLRLLSNDLFSWDLIALNEFYRVIYNGSLSPGQNFSWNRFYDQIKIFAQFVEPNSELIPSQFIQDNGYWLTGKWVFHPCYQNGYSEEKIFAGYTKPISGEINPAIRLDRFFKQKSKMNYTVPADRIDIIFDSNLETLIYLTDFTNFTNKNETEPKPVYLFPQIKICIPNCDWCRCEIYEVVAGVIQIEIGTSTLTKTYTQKKCDFMETHIVQKIASYYCFQTSTGWRLGDLSIDADLQLLNEVKISRLVDSILKEKN